MVFNKITRPKVLSLFSGCGGLDLAFHESGYKIVWANENNEWAVKTYKKNFNNPIVPGDIEEIDPYQDATIPECDVIIGGFPCQDFSMIWKRPGLDGERGNLYKSFLRFVDAKKPMAFVAENVKGLLSANNKNAIDQIIKDFENILPGYFVVPKLYNFADYGVPQLRERVLLVGIRIDTGFNFKHPQPTHGVGRSFKHKTAGEALEGVEKIKLNDEHMKIAQKTKDMLKLIGEGGNFTDIPKDHPLYVKGMISHVYRRIHRSEPSKTLIAAGGGGTWGYHYPEPRALTNRERARIQTFPDTFEFIGSFGEIRRQIGNAVPPDGAKPVAKELLNLFHKKYSPINLHDIIKNQKHLNVAQRLELSVT